MKRVRGGGTRPVSAVGADEGFVDHRDRAVGPGVKRQDLVKGKRGLEFERNCFRHDDGRPRPSPRADRSISQFRRVARAFASLGCRFRQNRHTTLAALPGLDGDLDEIP